MKNSEFICPICNSALFENGQAENGRGLRCEAGHSFDIAREGYVNLLTGKAPSLLQGDNAEMVRARRAFLGMGYYRPLAAAVAEAVAEMGPEVVADFGCGEGYYLGEVLSAPRQHKGRAYGTDISKSAIAAAAKAHPEARFAVADTNRLIPLADTSVDVALDIFAPRNAVEFARVVRPGGRLVVAVPGPGHLGAVRERYDLIGIEADKPAKIAAQLEKFELVDTRRVEAEIRLDAAGLRDLLEMTPNARHMTAQTREAVGGDDETLAHIEFDVLIFTRR